MEYKPKAHESLPGYTDTPLLPGSRWRVHDARRPQPRVVRPGEEPGQPPSDATLLFSGQDVSQWVGRDGGNVRWKIEDGVLEVVPKTGDIQTKAHFGDCHLHIEWATPAEVKGDGQGRGNSGIFLMDRYEIQVLDSYDNLTYADGQAAALYGQYPPLVNACRKPGQWQTFDIFFTASRFEGERLASPAYVTIIHNGLLVHHHQAFLGPTGHKILPAYDAPHAPQGPIRLQDHGDAVRYRNIWVRRIEDYDQE